MEQVEWKLKCRSCGEIFLIGKDAHLVTDEDMLAAIYRAGGKVIGDVAKRQPDLAQRGELPVDRLSKIADVIKKIKRDLAEGISRQWYCDNCKEVNSYPEF
jgi:hypothetical protein